MENPKEQFRQALKFLIKKNGTEVVFLSKKVGCTDRHIHGFTSGIKDRGMGEELRNKISAHYGLSYVDMLNLGQHIIDGHDPEAWKPPLRGHITQLQCVQPEITRNISKSEVEAGPSPGDSDNTWA